MKRLHPLADVLPEIEARNACLLPLLSELHEQQIYICNLEADLLAEMPYSTSPTLAAATPALMAQLASKADRMRVLSDAIGDARRQLKLMTQNFQEALCAKSSWTPGEKTCSTS